MSDSESEFIDDIDSCLNSGTTFWCKYNGGLKPNTWRECEPGKWEIEDVLFSVWHGDHKYIYALKKVVDFSLTKKSNFNKKQKVN